MASHRANKRLPGELTSRSRWTRCDGKRPVMADGRPASSTKPKTWTDYGNVLEGAGDGFGIMLGDGLGCYDLDDVDDADIRDFLAGVPERVIYVERSVSGRGAHIFVEAAEGPGRRQVVDGMKVERYTVGRFIRMTGVRM